MRANHHVSWMLGAIATATVAAATLLPAAANAGTAAYDFKIVGYPNPSAVSIALVDHATNTVVPNAQIFALHWVYGIAKGQTSHQVRLPLQVQSDGSFIANAKAGDRLQLVATVSGQDDTVDGTVLISSGPR
jgi:hypothetical protein